MQGSKVPFRSAAPGAHAMPRFSSSLGSLLLCELLPAPSPGTALGLALLQHPCQAPALALPHFPPMLGASTAHRAPCCTAASWRHPAPRTLLACEQTLKSCASAPHGRSCAQKQRQVPQGHTVLRTKGRFPRDAHSNTSLNHSGEKSSLGLPVSQLFLGQKADGRAAWNQTSVLHSYCFQ